MAGTWKNSPTPLVTVTFVMVIEGSILIYLSESYGSFSFQSVPFLKTNPTEDVSGAISNLQTAFPSLTSWKSFCPSSTPVCHVHIFHPS